MRGTLVRQLTPNTPVPACPKSRGPARGRLSLGVVPPVPQAPHEGQGGPASGPQGKASADPGAAPAGRTGFTAATGPEGGESPAPEAPEGLCAWLPSFTVSPPWSSDQVPNMQKDRKASPGSVRKSDCWKSEKA